MRGYRIIRPDEVLKEGDQYEKDGRFKCATWEPVEADKIGQLKGDVYHFSTRVRRATKQGGENSTRKGIHNGNRTSRLLGPAAEHA